MFTGIIETLGEVVSVTKDRSNVDIQIKSDISGELKVDQSVSHNGVCLTVTAVDGDVHTVTAIEETLQKSNIGKLNVGDRVNVERCVKSGGRLDGHIVQGHVDTTGICTSVKEEDGSWRYFFSHPVSPDFMTVAKGSITVNGVSLTVVDSAPEGFSVAVIPYTYEHTNFHTFEEGTEVNLEFDIVGKYVAEWLKRSQS
ncbi:MAG: riboflavin synthase [Cryomorphaceae bacterium]|nr:riboflavin synthase [Flavobacteriales bacterium]